ncbi:2OG-Fe(II) oxygenase [Agitococcus lubricus]|uniref:SM-20-related protein n=1 Tax=Agitococcus lubricus TaxID=1077255 RepID=A0A2T5IV21_9GAMM|nr:2OG-Fe(II) oxygenase [Agitococcus lubricus]PTQ87726.1 SM-20-related protein [Agitococcus lubricus]
MHESQSNQRVDWPVLDFANAIEELATQHYAVLPNFLSDAQQDALRRELVACQQQGLFHAAGIGRGQHHNLNRQIRGDSICWLEDDFNTGRHYLAQMDTLRHTLNASFYLGLQSFEAHYAHYQAGSVYQRHVDRHRDNDARVISSVCYLNADWPADAGGELQLFNAHDELLLRLPPLGGTLVLFMSADMPHEVLASTQSRYSIAGWFRRDEMTYALV